MDAEVVIAGAGPTGLLLAYELGRAGVPALVLDRSPHPDEQPRANGLVGQITRVLAYRGLLHGTPLHPVAVPRFPFGPLTLELDRLEASPLHVLPVPQRALEDLLHSAATAAGATVRRGHEVTGFAQTDDGVTLDVRGPDGDTTLTAGHLVGCDGGRSFVRKHAGIAFPGITSDEISRMARVTMPAGEVTVDGGTLTVRGVRLALLRPNRTATGTITVAPQRMLDPAADPDVYILATSEPLPPNRPDQPLTLDELRASVHRVIGTDLPITAAHWARSTVANSRQAETYRSGRVLLAGDAAHVFAAGGTALNAGLLDAVNLGWKLAATARGTAPAGLLDTYQAERHPAARRAILHTRAQAALSASGENAEALREILTDVLRHPGPLAHLAALMEGSDVTYGPGPLTGGWAPDVLDGPAATAAINQLSTGRPLVIDAADGGKIATAADPWRQRLDVVALPGAGPSAFIRPDGYLAWAGDSPDGLHEALTRWMGAP
ncbi:FAD-dependent monooxygenase [Dactylosporangium siamense]|uniref:FAD-dependent oxidoreductase n=1 Tax=Dactylosporangium siamense TaxID=685454 RepID=A0A919PUT9_9ACTN|nr:FAD-dependent monooxygenase [Dactylosporangium siamense]GIG48815.1 FAD-dependent oxidoreductase [Dactylosporangium siamense]